MGLRGPARSLMVSGAGYWIAPPPVGRDRMAEILGAPIADDVWRTIEKAFKDHQALLVHARAAAGTADYAEERARTKKAIEGAFNAAMAHAFAPGTEDIESMARHSKGGMAGTLDCDISGHLAKAAIRLDLALGAIRSAKPIVMEIPTAPAADARLVRYLRAVFKRAGLRTSLSDRRTLPDDASEADLTPFERLLSEAQVHVAESPDAHAKWVRDALRRSAHKT